MASAPRPDSSSPPRSSRPTSCWWSTASSAPPRPRPPRTSTSPWSRPRGATTASPGLQDALWRQVVSTGASKGGMTSIYHRASAPKDVDATVAYVAPQQL
ncbi:hypothetical protein ACLESD_47465, partial [Pyxidicoccus sp. 3LFB2]